MRAAATVPNNSTGFDAGKKIKGRKTFGIVDTLSETFEAIVEVDRALRVAAQQEHAEPTPVAELASRLWGETTRTRHT